ncbi:hypothetical protein MBLNU457_3925t2 [Dothideomycetes sp. NU457]
MPAEGEKEFQEEEEEEEDDTGVLGQPRDSNDGSGNNLEEQRDDDDNVGVDHPETRRQDSGVGQRTLPRETNALASSDSANLIIKRLSDLYFLPIKMFSSFVNGTTPCGPYEIELASDSL